MDISKRKSTLGGDAITLTVSRVLVSLLGLVTSMLLARFRTLEEYGTYSQIIMVADLLSTALLLGLPNSVNYFLAKAENKEDRQRFMSVYLTLSLLLSMVITACAFAALPIIVSYFDNPMITGFAYVFAAYPWSSLMINSLGNTCVVYGKANRLIFFNLAQSVCSILLLLVAKLFGIPFSTYLVLQMVLLVLLAVAAILWIRHMVGSLRLSLNRSLIKEIFIFSIPMGLASVVGTLNVELDKLVIGRFYTTQEYAIFTNAAKQLPVTVLTDSLTAVLLPCIVRLLKENRKDDVVKVWGNAIQIAFCIMCLIAGGLFVFAPDVMTLFYSAKYATPEGIAVFRIYAVMLLLRFTYWGIVLNATGNTKFILYSSIASMLLNLLGNVGMYYAFGFIGPAVSTVAVIVVISALQLSFTTKILGTTILNVFPWKNMVRFLLQTVLFGCIFYLLRYLYAQHANTTQVVILSIMSCCFWAALYIWVNRSIVLKNWSELNSFKNR